MVCVCKYEKISRMSVGISVLLWCNVYVMHVKWEGVRVKPVVDISLILSKSTNGAARFNVPF